MIEEVGRMGQLVPGEIPGLDLEAIYDCVDLVYQAIDRLELMPTALSALARIAEVEHIVIVSTSADGARRLFAEGHADPADSAEARTSARRIRSTSGAFIQLDGARTVPLIAGYELVVSNGDLSPEAIAALLRITPHLSRALRLVDRFAATGRALGSAVGSLDRLAFGVVLLDSTGSVVSINRLARSIVSSSSLLRIVQGRLLPSQSVPRTLLETLVERVVTPAAAGGSPRHLSGGQLELKAPGRATIRVLIAPYRARFDSCESACAVLLSSPGVTLEAEDVFVNSHQLTREEARVATLLVAGRDPVEALSEIEPQLVRAYQERVFVRLASTRQSDLVRILLRPAGVLFEDAAAGAV